MKFRLHTVAFGSRARDRGGIPRDGDGRWAADPGVYTDPEGVAALDGNEHYVTRPEKDDSTLVRTLAQDGRVLDSTTVSGRFVIPAVALDGSPAGLSADGTRLVLIQPRKRFPQRETHLAILDAQSLLLRERLTLHGDFSFDAISPDGSHIYLIAVPVAARSDPVRGARLRRCRRDRCSPNRSSTRTRRATRCAATP